MNHRTFVKSMKHIAVLGSTGSIGTQTLEVVAAHPEKFCVEVLTANTHWELLAEQARRFKPDCVVIADETKYGLLKEALRDEEVKVYAGEDAIAQVVKQSHIDIVFISNGIPPFSRTPYFICSERILRCIWPGCISL